ncbi:MAG TPA: tripartite tricarboxylate transporter substrate-binding protein [Vicinamibacterales bacterium]|nr:tripartite tricarboxylate transporter substrate-binding protein [Vicinamibacterales bacterium]
MPRPPSSARPLAAAAAAAWLLIAAATPAMAQTLTVVAPAAPGGGWDQTARAMQRALREVDPRAAVQVENVPGAAGTVGLARFVSAERGRPDALLVIGLVMVSGIATNGSAVSLGDVTPIARLTGEHEVIAVPADSPFRTLQDLVAALKRAPQSVSWGGGSAGGTDDLLARLLAEAVGVAPTDVNYVAFSGGGEALAAVLGGQVTAGISGFSEFSQSIAAGQLRALASSAPEREPGIDIPTLREAGVALDLANWRGVVAPPGISAAERAALTARVRAMAGSAAWRETLQRTGWTDLYADGATFRQFLLAEQARVVGVITRLQAGRAGTPSGFTPSPGTAPAAAVIITLGLGALLVWQRRGGRGRSSEAPAPGGAARVAAILGVCLAQALVLPVLGFVPTAAVVFTTGAYALGSRRVVRNAAIGVAVAGSLALLFGAGLDVPLPMGGWPR